MSDFVLKQLKSFYRLQKDSFPSFISKQSLLGESFSSAVKLEVPVESVQRIGAMSDWYNGWKTGNVYVAHDKHVAKIHGVLVLKTDANGDVVYSLEKELIKLGRHPVAFTTRGGSTRGGCQKTVIAETVCDVKRAANTTIVFHPQGCSLADFRVAGSKEEVLGKLSEALRRPDTRRASIGNEAVPG